MDNPTVTMRAVVSFPSLTQQIQYKGAPTGKYGLQLTQLSDAAVDRLSDLGVDTKFKDDDYGRGRFVDVKSKFVMDNSGKYPLLYEADGKTLFEDSADAIGYGSTVRATIRAYRGGDGVVRPSLVKLCVEDLVRPEVATEDEEVL